MILVNSLPQSLLTTECSRLEFGGQPFPGFGNDVDGGRAVSVGTGVERLHQSSVALLKKAISYSSLARIQL